MLTRCIELLLLMARRRVRLSAVLPLVVPLKVLLLLLLLILLGLLADHVAGAGVKVRI